MNKDYFPPMHTAEHILNQTMVRKFNIDRSFSNHIERKKSKCDYYFSRDLTDDEVKEIEEKINEIINQQLNVTEHYINREEAEEILNLNKLPEDAGDRIRVIKIGDYDSCPCSGSHVNNTSEIGRFKIISRSFADNVLRIRFKLISTVI